MKPTSWGKKLIIQSLKGNTNKEPKKNQPQETNLALCFFMKSGPCLMKSVVSPKSGHPIVPGGSPLLLYLISFHFKRAKQTDKATTKTKITTKTAIDAPKKPQPTSERVL